MQLKQTLIATAVTAVLLSACSDSGTVVGSTTDDQSPLAKSKLKVIDNSDEFYTAIREGLIHQFSGNQFGTDDLAVTSGVAQNSGNEGASPESSADSAATAGDTATADTAASSPPSREEVTGTNVQELGVDEQDRVKTDGHYLYVLDNTYNDFYPLPGITEVLPVDGPMAVDVATSDSVGGEPVSIDGDSIGSTFPAQRTATTLRILSLQPDAPDATPVADVEIDMRGRQVDGMYLYGNDSGQNVILTSSGFNNYWAYWSDSASFGGQDSAITRIDVSDPTQVSITDSFRIDGQIISSRRIGKHLFVASRFYPQIPNIDPYSSTPEEWRATVEATDIAAVLPKFTRQSDNTSQPLIDPKACFVAAGTEQSIYYSPDIISLSVIDLDTMQLTDSECYLGATETLYATPNAVYLATTRWDYQSRPEIDFPVIATADSGGATATSVAPDEVVDFVYNDPRVDTDIHQFSIEGGQLTYTGSGVVTGHLGWNELRKPFRMSEKDGYLRVATYSDQQNSSVSPINISVLQPDGAGALKTIAQLPNPNRPKHIGKPGEQLYASRFLGDRAYLVTFRQTDPLYVIDMANPADPILAGELEIAGYSDYLHPIDENFLLGIGKDAFPVPGFAGDGRGALTQGVKLSLFNVSNPAAPTEVQSIVIGQRGTTSQALNNHRAITVQAATDQHPTRVSFGIDVAGRPDPQSPLSADQASTWYPWNFTGLHGFEVRVGPDAGIEKVGVMQVESASDGTFRYGQGGNDRSVIFNDSVYYIHGRDVYAAPWFNMSNKVGPR